MSRKAEVLIQILEKVPDSNKVQRLLEPENLLYLLQQYGYQKEELQKRVKSGTLPGELLLELLEKESDPEYLLAMLNNTMDTKVEKRVVIDEIINQGRKEGKIPSSPAAASAPSSSVRTVSEKAKGTPSSFDLTTSPTSMSNEGSSLFERPMMQAAIVVVTVTAILPALMHTGFFSEINIIPSPAFALVLAFIGGIIAGALFSQTTGHARWKGVLMGVVLNVGVLLTTIVYSQARTELFSIEVAIPLLLGSIPALVLYIILIWFKDH